MFRLFASTSDLEQIRFQLSLESVQSHLWSPYSSRKTVPQRWSRDSEAAPADRGSVSSSVLGDVEISFRAHIRIDVSFKAWAFSQRCLHTRGCLKMSDMCREHSNSNISQALRSFSTAGELPVFTHPRSRYECPAGHGAAARFFNVDVGVCNVYVVSSRPDNGRRLSRGSPRSSNSTTVLPDTRNLRASLIRRSHHNVGGLVGHIRRRS